VKALIPYTWHETPCRIVHSEVLTPSSGDDYGFAVAYVYRDAAGREHRSERVADGGMGPAAKGKLTQAQRLAARFPVGAETVCHVHPGDPGKAVLVREIPWPMLPFMLIPLLFMAIGFGGIWKTWRRPPSSPLAAPTSAAVTSPPSSSTAGPLLIFVFFFLMGGGLVVPFGILPVWRAAQAKTWPTVSCRVVSSRVVSHSDSDGTTYSVDILYEYEYGGRTWRSNRYDFMGGSSSGRARKQAVVDRHPPGAETTCHVRPDEPETAVLVRGFTPVMLVGLVPLVFMLVGLAGMIATLRKRLGAGGGRPEYRSSPGVHAYDPRSLGNGYRPGGDLRSSPAPRDGGLALTPKSLWLKAFGLLLATAFWNGIVGIFVYFAVDGWRRGRPEWFMMVFLIPFVGIGLLLVVGWVQAVLAALNPRPRLCLAGPLRPGTKVGLDWEFRGWAGRIREMAIILEGWESALKESGDSSSWMTSCFCRLVVARAHGPGIRHGQATVAVPAEAMSSWTAARSKVEWRFRCRGRIGLWPNIDVEFPVAMALPVPDEGAPSVAILEVVPEDAERDSGDGVALPLEIVVDGDGAAFAPGERVTGRVRWRLAGAPRSLELRLAWLAGQDAGDGREAVVQAVASLSPRARGMAAFTMILPPGPSSCFGTHVRLDWILEAVATKPDATCARGFVMAPERREIHLDSARDFAW
jgi:hypothetical protein